jgi:hypothetical protein
VTSIEGAVARPCPGVSAVMALDAVCLAVGVRAAGRRPPVIGVACVVLRGAGEAGSHPGRAGAARHRLRQGERIVVVEAGFLCAAGETLYGTYPTAWWSTS